MGAAETAVALRFWDAVEANEGDLSTLHEEVEVRDFDLPDAGVYHGHEGFLRWVSQWEEPWAHYQAEMHDLLDLGAQVMSLSHLDARTDSDLMVARAEAQLLTVRDGRVAKLEWFGDPGAALERAIDPGRAMVRKAVHERIRALYQAAVREDVEGVVAQIAPDYEFHPEAGSPMGPAYRGHDGARDYFEEVFDAWEVLAFDVERLVDAGDRVVALFEMRNRGRGSGAELTGRWAETWETSGDALTASRFYQSHDEALAAAGLPAPSTSG